MLSAVLTLEVEWHELPSYNRTGTQPYEYLCSVVAVPDDNCCASSVVGAKRREKHYEREAREREARHAKERRETAVHVIFQQ
jgi:hypothetical protein